MNSTTPNLVLYYSSTPNICLGTYILMSPLETKIAPNWCFTPIWCSIGVGLRATSVLHQNDEKYQFSVNFFSNIIPK